jgi:choline monooxygenase
VTADSSTIAGLPPLEHPLEDGWTLPAAWYTDPAVAERERREIFARSWQYAGWTSQLPEVGSFFTTQAGHIPVVVLRDADGALRAYVNVCRHRGHLIASGQGCQQSLQCPYHAWTYGLDGSLRRAPRADREPGFSAAELSLLPLAVDTWGPFVFVNPDADAEPLATTLADLPRLVAASGVDLEGLRFHSHEEWTIEANWKIALENYLECYHCPVAHPGFSRVIDVDPDAYRLQVRPTYSSQVGPVRASALAGNGKAPYVPSGDVQQSQYHFVWPNTTINIAPGIQNVSIERWVPTGPRTTLEVTDYFFAPDADEREVRELLAFDWQVAEEDTALVIGVQAGVNSGVVTQGRLMPESEQLVADFQRRVHAALDGGS